MSEPLFVRAIVKRLSAVDLPTGTSNQHEIGANLLHRMLHEAGWAVDASPVPLDVLVLRLQDDDEADATTDALTLYDTRSRNPNRGPEWRLYYPAGGELERILRASHPGDLLLYGLLGDGRVVLATTEAGSESEALLAEAAAVNLADVSGRLRLFTRQEPQGEVGIRLVFEELGLAPDPDQSDLEWLASRGIELGDDLPSPFDMARLACERASKGDAVDVDELVLLRLETETRLFYALERAEAGPRFDACGSVDETLAVAKSVLNRRSSRRGRSFERHLEILFEELGLQHETQVETEASSRADFIFPSAAVYAASNDPDTDAVHLGVKSTLRERWKQILSEAGRLTTRHLATLDRRISLATRDAMSEAQVILVVPRPMRESAYKEDERILTVQEFVDHARAVSG